MQVAEKMMAKWMGIEVHAFEFKETEVSEMEPTYATGASAGKRGKQPKNPTVAQPAASVDLTAAALGLADAAAAQPDASVALTDAAASVRVAVAETGVKQHKEIPRDETAFKQRLEEFLFKHGICAEMRNEQ